MPSPILAVGGDAILAHNVVMLLSFPLCGLAANLLARDLTGSRVGAFLAALTYAFCAYRFYQLVHIQSLAMQWLPAALFAIRRALATRAETWSIAASVLFVFAILGSGYYVLITVFISTLGATSSCPTRTGSRVEHPGATVPHDRGPVAHDRWLAFLDPHAPWPLGGRAARDRTLAIARPRGPDRPLAIPGPFEILRLLPGGALLRTASRLGVLAILGFALLAAATWAEIERRRVRHSRVLSILAIAVVLVETYPYNLVRLMSPLEPPPATTAWLAAASSGAVLELPWDHETEGLGATYVYWSTRHWQPMVNGWSAFEPRGPFAHGVLGKLFPSNYTAQQFRQADRRGRIERATRVIDLPAGVRLAASMGPDRVYEIERGTRKKP